MGLGKTLSMISLIAHDSCLQKAKSSASGRTKVHESTQQHVHATLIVVPPARKYMARGGGSKADSRRNLSLASVGRAIVQVCPTIRSFPRASATSRYRVLLAAWGSL